MSDLPLSRYYKWMFLVGVILLIVPGGLLAYFLTPMLGGGEADMVGLIYVLDNILPYTLVLGVVLILGQIVHVLRTQPLRVRMGMIFFCVFLLGFNYLANVKMRASGMFGEVEKKILVDASANKVSLDRLVIGVEKNGAATAYPVDMIAYHHRLQDTVGGMPVLVTYCSLCRTGVVFNPIVDGQHLYFRLIGTQNYNAILEDKTTGTWWYQANGEAVEGPNAGKRMQEIESRQMPLRNWLALHPNSRVLQPDPTFTEIYKRMQGYDTTYAMELDTTGHRQNWGDWNRVVGLTLGSGARAYQEYQLATHPVVNDTIGGVGVVVAYDPAASTAYAWKSAVGGTPHVFAPDSAGRMSDNVTHSVWDRNGRAIEGPYTGKTLEPVTVRYAYWHAWRTFRPNTTQWNPTP